MVPKALYLLLIACILGTIIQMSLADSDKTDSAKPDSDKPDSAKPDSDKPDSDKPDSDKPDSDKPDSAKPDSAKPDSAKPDSAKPDSAKPDSDKPDSDKPDSAKPDSAKPDSAKPDSAKPDSAKPDSAKSDSSKTKEKSAEHGHDKDDQKPRKPPTIKEEIENKIVVKKLDIVLPKIPAISPIRGLKPNVEKAKEIVARRLSSGSDFVNAVANTIRLAVHAVKPLLAISDLIAKIIGVFAEIASLNPISMGALILQEGLKIGMGVMSVSLPLIIAGAIGTAS